jgi:hypothetical protein
VLLLLAPPVLAGDDMPEFQPAQGLENPTLGMGLNGISDWSTQHPFIDLMKTARPWIGHLPGQWGGMDADELVARGVLDRFGWPKSIPDKVTHLETLILTNQPEAAIGLIGRYRLSFKGSGTITVTGRAQNIRASGKEIEFDFTPGEGLIGIAISATDPVQTGDYIRDISVVRVENIPLFEVGAIFNPDWFKHVRDLRLVRFMDWMQTNGSISKSWQDRPLPQHYTYGDKGVPVEVMVALANQIGADAWFNMPHQANDAYVQKFAEYVQVNLATGLKAHVEYSNEVWNFIFPQAEWAAEQARARWGEDAPGDAWLQFTGMRAAEMAQIRTTVFGETASDRLVRVIATHTGWPGLEASLLEAPLWMAENPAPLQPPVSYFDAYAVTGYFGHEVGTDTLAPQVLNWINESKAEAVKQAETLGLKGQVLAQYLAASEYAVVDKKLADYLTENALPELLNEVFPYHAQVAREHGLDLIMYEGGSHIVGLGPWVENQALTDFFNHFSYTNEMAGLYRDVLLGWAKAGGTVFNGFVDVADLVKWGSWGALRHLDDINPRAAALAAFNRQPPDWGGNRAGGVFLQGLTKTGSDGADHLGGTPKADILIGLTGDDELLALGDGDRLNGGPGHDIAVLPGVVEQYNFHREGDLLVADGPQGKTWMIGIETIRFVPTVSPENPMLQ